MADPYRFRASCLAIGWLIGVAAALPARAADAPDRIGLETGGSNGITERLAEDLATLLNEGGARRIVPMVRPEGTEAIGDLLNGGGVDVAVLQLDVLDDARSRDLFANLDSGIRYVTRLHNAEFHLLARPGVTKIADLAGKVVNVGAANGNTAITTGRIFGLLNVPIITRDDPPDVAIDKLRRGEIAAVAYVGGKPAPLLRLTETGGLHLVPVPLTPAIAATYVPGTFTAADYPALVTPAAAVETVAAPIGLFVGPVAAGSDRYRALAGMVDALFSGFPTLLTPGHHPKWAEVNLAVSIPGWQRFAPAEDWLKRQAPVATDQDLRRIAEKMAELERQFDQLKRAQSGHADDTAHADNTARPRPNGSAADAMPAAAREGGVPDTAPSGNAPPTSSPAATVTTASVIPIRPLSAPMTAAASLDPKPTPEWVRSLLNRGDAMLRDGDVLAARLFYERAAAAGSGQGALSAGKTYDPNVLAAIDAPGLKGDPARAAEWYRIASGQLGDHDADPLLKALTSHGGR